MNVSDPTVQLWIAVSGWIIGVISAIVGGYALYLYLRDKRFKRAYWTIDTQPVIVDSISRIPRLEITYDGKKIQNFYRTDVRLWSSGTEALRETDIASNDPPRIKVAEHVTVFNVTPAEANSRAPKVSRTVTEEPKSIHVAFDFLEKDQGLTFSVYHDEASESDFSMKGTLIDSRFEHFDIWTMAGRSATWATSGVLVWASSFSIFLTFLLFAYLSWDINQDKTWIYIIAGILGLICLFSIKVAKKMQNTPPLIPRGL